MMPWGPLTSLTYVQVQRGCLFVPEQNTLKNTHMQKEETHHGGGVLQRLLLQHVDRAQLHHGVMEVLGRAGQRQDVLEAQLPKKLCGEQVPVVAPVLVGVRSEGQGREAVPEGVEVGLAPLVLLLREHRGNEAHACHAQVAVILVTQDVTAESSKKGKS